MKKIVSIYKITSPSGRVYIGQSWDTKSRWAAHGYKNVTPKLCASFNKYGKQAHKFEIIHELPNDIDQNVLDVYEQLYIDLYRVCGINLLNIREAGSRGRHSEQTKSLIGAQSKGRAGYWTGKTLPDEVRDKIRQANIGKAIPKEVIEKAKTTRKKNAIYAKWTEERKKAWSKMLKGRKFSAEVRANMSKSHMGAVYTEERNEKVRQANIGKKRSPEARLAMSLAKKGRKPSPQTLEALKRANLGNKHRLGIKHSDEDRRKISKGLLRYNKNKLNGTTN